MRNWSLVAVAFLFIACGDGFDPDKVQLGMSTERLIEVAGEPEEKLPMMEDYEFWRYERDHMVMIGNGRVMNIGMMSDEEYQRTTRHLRKTMNTLNETRQK